MLNHENPAELLNLICYYTGIAGFVLYIIGFAGLQMRKFCGNSYSYIFINVVAASFVLVGLYHEFNMASALIQISWIAIGMYGIFAKMIRDNQIRGKYLSVWTPEFLSTHRN